MEMIPHGKVDYDLKTIFPLFSRYIYHLCNDQESVAYSTMSVLRNFEEDGVVYLELRTTPRDLTGLTKEHYLDTVLSTICKYETDPNTSMKISLILSIDRRDSIEKANQCVDLAIKNKDRGVVGVDLCGDPLKGDVATFRDAFARAKAHNLGITVHFGEAEATSSCEELMTLLSFQPDRLGHIIHVPNIVKQEITRRRLGLELCISCNIHARMGHSHAFADHHFGQWWKENTCPLILCTDDVGVFCSQCSNEYVVVATHFGLSRLELWELSLQAIDVIFGDEAMKTTLRQRMVDWKEKEGL